MELEEQTMNQGKRIEEKDAGVEGKVSTMWVNYADLLKLVLPLDLRPYNIILMNSDYVVICYNNIWNLLYVVL